MANAQLLIGGRWRYRTPDLGALLCVAGGSVALGEPLADGDTWFNWLPHNGEPRHSIEGSDYFCCSTVVVTVGLSAARRTGR